MSNLTEIQEDRAKAVAALDKTTDELCEARVKKLVSRLTSFNITAITMGMGVWILQGDEYPACFQDGTTELCGLHNLSYWNDSPANSNYAPANITADECASLDELCELCDWWLDETGGHDVRFVKVELGQCLCGGKRAGQLGPPREKPDNLRIYGHRQRCPVCHALWIPLQKP